VGAIYHFLQRIWSAWPGGRAWVLYIHSFSLKKSETPPTSPPSGYRAGQTAGTRYALAVVAVLSAGKQLRTRFGQCCFVLGIICLCSRHERRIVLFAISENVIFRSWALLGCSWSAVRPGATPLRCALDPHRKRKSRPTRLQPSSRSSKPAGDLRSRFKTTSALCSRAWPIFRSIESLNSRPALGPPATNRRNPATPSTVQLVRRSLCNG
jgi:hypothetical protein